MKKGICIYIIIIVTIILCSCGENNSKKRIYSIDNGACSGEQSSYIPDIEKKVIREVDETKRGLKKSVEFLNRTFELEYVETLHYLFGDIYVDNYKILNLGGEMSLLPNGKIFRNTAFFGTIDIGDDYEVDVIRQKVEDYLADEINFGDFEFFEYSKSLNNNPKEFGMFTFVWYNKEHDLQTDKWLKVCVMQDSGDLGGLWMLNNCDISYDEIPDGVRAENYDKEIRAKLETMYNKFVDYEITSQALTKYEGKTCLKVGLGVSFLDENGNEWSDAIELLIVLEE